MSADRNSVVYLHRRVPQEALERLNRITGLQFSNWPESLVAASCEQEPVVTASRRAVLELCVR